MPVTGEPFTFVLFQCGGAGARAINLTTSPLIRGSNYTLTVSNVRDRAAAQNTIASNSQRTFTVLLKGIYREVFTPIAGSYIDNLSNSPSFLNSPASA